MLRLRLLIKHFGFDQKLRQYEIFDKDCRMCKVLKQYFNKSEALSAIPSLRLIMEYCLPSYQSVNIIKTNDEIFIDSDYLGIKKDNKTQLISINDVTIGSIKNNEYHRNTEAYTYYFLLNKTELSNMLTVDELQQKYDELFKKY